jgi:hypothetical protein
VEVSSNEKAIRILVERYDIAGQSYWGLQRRPFHDLDRE